MSLGALRTPAPPPPLLPNGVRACVHLMGMCRLQRTRHWVGCVVVRGDPLLLFP